MTTLRNSPERWGWLAQLLHWSIALLIIGLAIVGLTMDDLPNSPDKLKVYALHKSVGLTVLVLVLIRLVWRFVDPRPPYPATIPRWQRKLSDLTHGLLYVLMLAMPISGWLYNSASNFPLRWFGLFAVPALSGPDKALKAFAHEAHEIGFYLLALLMLLHVAAAMKHHFFDRDATLARMTPGLPSPTAAAPNKEIA
jgi:cytochrome b561